MLLVNVGKAQVKVWSFAPDLRMVCVKTFSGEVQESLGDWIRPEIVQAKDRAMEFINSSLPIEVSPGEFVSRREVSRYSLTVEEHWA